MAVTVLGHIKESKGSNKAAHLQNAINYILNPDKTENRLWCGGNVGTEPKEVFDAFINTKKDFQKKWGRQGYHYVLSFPPGEGSEEILYNFANEFAEKYLNDAYDYCFAVHNDQDHLHIHMIFNSVDRLEGMKYRYVKGDWEKYIQPVTDLLCEKYGLSKLEYDKEERKGKSYAEHLAEQENRFTWKSIVRADIDSAIKKSSSREEFLNEMRAMGYAINRGFSKTYGEYYSYHAPGSERARRDYRLGEGYMINQIDQRIKNKDDKISEKRELPFKLEKIDLSNRYQKQMYLRINIAINYQKLEIFSYDPAMARKDLIKINKLAEECNYLAKHPNLDKEGIEQAIKEVNRQIKFEKQKTYDQKNLTSELSTSDRVIYERYKNLKIKISNANISDEAFEKAADEIEKLEEEYADVIFMSENISNPDVNLINYLRAEHRMLIRLRKKYDETMELKEAIYKKDELKKDTEKKL